VCERMNLYDYNLLVHHAAAPTLYAAFPPSDEPDIVNIQL
jgi:hypothetical protein